MAYNPIFPAIGYNPYLPPQINLPAQTTQQQNIIWVNGKAGADNYQLAPNNSGLPLWDSESQTIYIKSTDQTGKPSMKILDYTIREEKTIESNQSQPEYLTKEEFQKHMESFISRVKEMIGTSTKSEKSINRNLEG